MRLQIEGQLQVMLDGQQIEFASANCIRNQVVPGDAFPQPHVLAQSRLQSLDKRLTLARLRNPRQKVDPYIRKTLEIRDDAIEEICQELRERRRGIPRKARCARRGS